MPVIACHRLSAAGDWQGRSSRGLGACLVLRTTGGLASARPGGPPTNGIQTPVCELSAMGV